MTLRLLALALTLSTATPALAQQCGGDFASWKSIIAEEARQAGIGQRGLNALAGSTLQERVLQRDRSQSFFSQTFNEFSGKLISQQRVNKGREKLNELSRVFSRAESEFGVPGPVLAAFWALESDFGTFQGDFPSLSALVTLAHDCRRPELFRPQVLPMLQLIDHGDLPADATGAWAGEVGQTQMLPSDVLALGVDGDGDGIIDVRNSAPDALLTTARKIQSKGWKSGEPWLQEVRIPNKLPWHETGRSKKLPVSQWSKWGVTDRNGKKLADSGLNAGLVLPMGHKGPAFLSYHNYDVYLEWNQSLIYTLTAAHLAARIAGEPAFDKRNPEPGLDLEPMKLLQTKLQARGYDVGKIDGILGVGTREAVRTEQDRLGLPVDGWPTPALLSNL
ncbi:lytic murein transglycosylase [Mesorhizobium sp. NBSH29]|uniref:lytic murein transglycosylase n=1 Tax=Mesorhizobium sp. NBSH29 TaxID=2654249 RepID=UPI0018965614|nr:lytic murein transglycosylase [Mesorhizobium sp. NBSH29]QPC88234.1 lytic murein transglycosylase [Mesorhizobium sp. NBSH29]